MGLHVFSQWPQASILTYGGIFGAVGAVSGITTGLALARGESGRSVEQIPTWRAALWGFLGGFAPAGLLGGLAFALGTVAAAFVPIVVVGCVSGAMTAGLAASVSVAAKRISGGGSAEQPSLPTT